MAKTLPIPRKRRTRAHVIASQSLNFVERFICDAGFTAKRVEEDYGYDLAMRTYDADGFMEPGEVLFQVKASDSMKPSSTGEHYVISIRIEDYNLWIHELEPVFLVLFDAQRRRGYWLHIQPYFAENPSRRPRPGAASVRVFLPQQNRFGRHAIQQARRYNAVVQGFTI